MRRSALVAALLILGATSCTPDGNELYVSAAASLAEAFQEIEMAFEEAHPGVDVVLNLGGSATLGYQIGEGAPVDVFASANESTMRDVEIEGWTASRPVAFASNTLQIVVGEGNPLGVTDLYSLASSGALVGACAPAVPCGDLAEAILTEAGVEIEFATREPSVRSVLEKVASGDLDAGLVYTTDRAPSVSTVSIESDLHSLYPVAAINDNDIAHEFVRFVTSRQGQAILSSYGFGPP